MKLKIRCMAVFAMILSALGCTAQDSKAGDSIDGDSYTTANGMDISVSCIKHGSVKMRIGDRWVYVDPVTAAVPPVTDYSGMPKADIILITHEHQDHLDSVAIRQLSKASTLVITNQRCSELLGGKGKVMKNGDRTEVFGGISIEAVPAYNSSADKMQFHPKGRDNGYVLTADGFRIYIAGDTEDIEEMKGIKDIDVAFLPCNLPFTMSPEQLLNAARTIKSKVLYPYHLGQTDMQKVRDLFSGDKTLRVFKRH